MGARQRFFSSHSLFEEGLGLSTNRNLQLPVKKTLDSIVQMKTLILPVLISVVFSTLAISASAAILDAHVACSV
jgi:hypothetical protein